MRSRGFTLVEIMIVVLIIGILLGIAVPQFMRARDRSQQSSCVSNLRQIENAKELWATEMREPDGAPCVEADLWPDFIRGDNFPECPAGGVYTIGIVGAVPSCSETVGAYPHQLR